MTDYTDALRNLADFIDRHPGLRIGTAYNQVSVHTSGTTLDFHIHLYEGEDADRAAVKAIVRAFGGAWDKTVNGETMYVQQGGVLDYFNACIFVDRDAVCERKVVGMEEVVIPAVEAAPARVEDREIIEWDCGSLLAPEPVTA